MNLNVDNSIAAKWGVLTTLKHVELVSLCTHWSRFDGMRDKFDPFSQPSISSMA